LVFTQGITEEKHPISVGSVNRGPSHEEIRFSPFSYAAISLFAIVCGRAPVTYLAVQTYWLHIGIANTSSSDGFTRCPQRAYR